MVKEDLRQRQGCSVNGLCDMTRFLPFFSTAFSWMMLKIKPLNLFLKLSQAQDTAWNLDWSAFITLLKEPVTSHPPVSVMFLAKNSLHESGGYKRAGPTSLPVFLPAPPACLAPGKLDH